MNYTHYKIWTGPYDVNRIAGALKDAGIGGVFAGTEHVYFNGSPDKIEALLQVERILGYRFQYSDVKYA